MKKFILAVLLFITLLFFGLFRLSPTILSGDTGELAGAGATLGIAHSPGYPLYCILGRIFTFLFPFGNYAYRMNLMSLFFGSLTCVLVYLIILLLSGSILLAIVLAFTLSFAKIFWTQSLVSEVFTLNTFFAVLLIYLSLNSLSNRSLAPRFLYLFSFLFGLGLGNHHTLILFLPGFVYFWWKNRSLITFRSLLIAFCFFIFGLTVYLYIPLRSLEQPLFDWEDPQTLERFWGLVTRARYGTLQLAQGGGIKLDFNLLFKGIFFFFQILNETITPVGTILFLLGLFFLFLKREYREIGIFLLLTLFFTGPFFLSFSGVRTLSPGIKYILERFMTLPLIFVVIISGYFFSYQIFTRSPRKFIQGSHLTGIFLILPVWLLLQNLSSVNQRENFFFYDYGKNLLRNARDNSIIFSDRADETEFSLAYLLNAEGKRRDLRFIDCNAGVSRSIYGDDYYRIWGKPRLVRRDKVEMEMIKNTKEVVYYSTLLPEQTVIPKYPDGLLFKVKPENRKINWQEFYFLRKPRIIQGFIRGRPLENDIRGENLFLSYYNLLGKYFLDIGSLNQVRSMFEGLKTYGEKKDWILMTAYSYYEKGYLKEAEKEYQEALEINPNWAEALSNLGVIYEQKNELEKAIEFYQRAILIKPDYPEVYYNLGVLYWKKGEWDKVVTNFEKVLQYNPVHEEARKHLPEVKGKLKVKR